MVWLSQESCGIVRVDSPPTKVYTSYVQLLLQSKHEAAVLCSQLGLSNIAIAAAAMTAPAAAP